MGRVRRGEGSPAPLHSGGREPHECRVPLRPWPVAAVMPARQRRSQNCARETLANGGSCSVRETTGGGGSAPVSCLSPAIAGNRHRPGRGGRGRPWQSSGQCPGSRPPLFRCRAKKGLPLLNGDVDCELFLQPPPPPPPTAHFRRSVDVLPGAFNP